VWTAQNTQTPNRVVRRTRLRKGKFNIATVSRHRLVPREITVVSRYIVDGISIGIAQVPQQTIGAHRSTRQRPPSFRKFMRDCRTRPPRHMRPDEFGNRKWAPCLTAISISGYTYQKQKAALHTPPVRLAGETALDRLVWTRPTRALEGAPPRHLRAAASLRLALTSPSFRDLRFPSLEYFYRCSDDRPFGFRARRRLGTRHHGVGNPDSVLNSVLSLPRGDDTYQRGIRR
jgi:hypothetical protein